MAEQNNDLIAGRNAVSEALRSQRSINKILLQEGAHGGSLGHQGHHAALLGVQGLGLQCLAGDDQPALDLSKQFFLIHCFSPPF